ncbi:hypothetical protein NP570_24630, partial [Vibrio parahaemolyticus]|nr:hypothetical protein [Vibrio parahaemolyticus]
LVISVHVCNQKKEYHLLTRHISTILPFQLIDPFVLASRNSNLRFNDVKYTSSSFNITLEFLALYCLSFDQEDI